MLPPPAPAAERKSLLGSLFGGKKYRKGRSSRSECSIFRAGRPSSSSPSRCWRGCSRCPTCCRQRARPAAGLVPAEPHQSRPRPARRRPLPAGSRPALGAERAPDQPVRFGARRAAQAADRLQGRHRRAAAAPWSWCCATRPARQGDRGDPHRRPLARRVGQRRHDPARLLGPGPVPPQEGSDRPVDRDPAPPRRRDRHHRAHHRAPGRRPHPAAGAGHQGHHRPQAQDQPDRQAHLPSGQRGRGRGRPEPAGQPAAHHLPGADARGHAGAAATNPKAWEEIQSGQSADDARADLPALPAAMPAGVQARGRGRRGSRRRQGHLRAAAGRPADHQLHLQCRRRPRLLRRHPREHRQAAGDPARQRDHQRAGRAERDLRRQRHHHRQLHHPADPGAGAAAALGRAAGHAHHHRGAHGGRRSRRRRHPCRHGRGAGRHGRWSSCFMLVVYGPVFGGFASSP